jgi:CRISPR system Cascade subunit CasE
MSTPLTLSRARLAIRPGGSEAERRSTSPYLIHQAVADLFGDRDDRGYLYRVTAEPAGGADVLVLSHTPPLSLGELASPAHRRAERVESKFFAPALTGGQPLDFEIRLNATQVVTDPTTGRKRRTDVWEAVWQADQQTPRTPHDVYGEYLQRKLEDVAEVRSARVVERGEVRARRGDRREAIRFVAVNVIGTLTVLDPTRFLEVVAAGIGRSKAFGCGLLCLSAPGTVLARRYPEHARGLL